MNEPNGNVDDIAKVLTDGGHKVAFDIPASTTPTAADSEPASPTMPYAKPGHGRNQYTWAPGRGGPGSPKGTANNLQAGRRAQKTMRTALTLGKLPERYREREPQLASLQRQVESAVIAAHGGINLTHAALIETILRNELRAWMAWGWLEESHDKLEPETRLRFMADIAQASAARDKAIAGLNLNRSFKAQVASAFEEMHKAQQRSVVAVVEPSAKDGEPCQV